MGKIREILNKEYSLKKKRSIDNGYSTNDDYNDINSHLKEIYNILKDYEGKSSCQIVAEIQQELDKIYAVCKEN